MKCRFVFSAVDGEKKAASCTRCGRKVTVPKATPAVHAECRSSPGIPKVMLGDALAGTLGAIGVSKQTVSRIVGRDCGCSRRQSQLNRWGLEQQERLDVAIYEVAKFLGITADHGVNDDAPAASEGDTKPTKQDKLD